LLESIAGFNEYIEEVLVCEKGSVEMLDEIIGHTHHNACDLKYSHPLVGDEGRTVPSHTRFRRLPFLIDIMFDAVSFERNYVGVTKVLNDTIRDEALDGEIAFDVYGLVDWSSI
jgi:hypothetical protein